MNRTSIKNVVIGTTLGDASDVIVRAGLQLACAAGAKAHLVTAYELPVSYGGVPYAGAPPLVSPLYEEELVRDLNSSLVEQAKRVGGENPSALTLQVQCGPAHRVLLDVARRVKADLIIVGAADTFLGRIFGTTASRVLRGAERPVLLLRGPLHLPPDRVLIPTDLSPISAEVVARGLSILEQLGAVRGEANVEAFYALPPVGYEGYALHFDAATRAKAKTEDLEAFLAWNVLGTGWNLARRTEFGPARERILSRVETFHANLVIMGTHGAGGFERFLVGSVAETVLRSAPVSIMVIPPHAAGYEISAHPNELAIALPTSAVGVSAA